MSSFDNPAIAEADRTTVYSLACYREVRPEQWSLCPVCKQGDATVLATDPLVTRCNAATRLDDGIVALGHELMLAVGQRITASIMARQVKAEPSPDALPSRHVGLLDGGPGIWRFGRGLPPVDSRRLR